MLEPIVAQIVAQNCVKIVTKKAPLILMTVGIGGMGASTVMAVKATPKANAIYKQIMRTPDLPPNERNKEILKRVVPLYAPAALAAVCGATCVVGSYSINMARLAEITAAYALAQNNLTTYRKQVEEKYGKEAEQEVHEESVKKVEERWEKDSNRDLPVPIVNDFNLKLYEDGLTGQRFWSTDKRIINSILRINDRIKSESHIFYSEYGLDVGMLACKAMDVDGWLYGDEIYVDISEDEYVTPKGEKYRTVHIDTNPDFKRYLKEGDYM